MVALVDYTELERECPGFISKGKPRKKVKASRKYQQAKNTRSVRDYVFARERNIDRVTRSLPAESMHELLFRSLGGKVSRRNSIAVHGSGTHGTHYYLQSNQIGYRFEDDALGAEGTVYFEVKTQAAADHCRVAVGFVIVSPPMVQTEID